MQARQPVVYLHIGAMKTGTSFIQGLLARNKQNLAGSGYLFPGHTWREQSWAARDILGMYKKDEKLRRQCAGMWDKLAAEMTAYDGKASIFSMEFLSHARPAGAARIVESLTSRGAEVRVVLTVRDAIKTLPAQWQTNVRNGARASWPDYVRGARKVSAPDPSDSPSKGERVWRRAQAIPQMLEIWGAAVQPGHLYVVTLPPSGSDPNLLWERFAEAVGLDPACCPIRRGGSNESIGQASAELIRLINCQLAKVPTTAYAATLKSQLARRILASRSKLEKRPVLDTETLQFAVEWNRTVREAVRASGAHVMGDLDDLPTEVPPELAAAAPHSPSDPDDDEVLAAAVTAREGLHRLVDGRVKLLRESRGDDVVLPPAATARQGSVTTERWSDPGGPGDAVDPVADAVTELTDLVRVAIDLQEQLHTTPAPEHDARAARRTGQRGALPRVRVVTSTCRSWLGGKLRRVRASRVSSRALSRSRR